MTYGAAWNRKCTAPVSCARTRTLAWTPMTVLSSITPRERGANRFGPMVRGPRPGANDGAPRPETAPGPPRGEGDGMTTTVAPGGATRAEGHLRRDVGFWGLTFVSLGSIIGSGWLLGALTAAKLAGPASLLSWILAAVMLALLALVHAELGAAYPIAGGTARFPAFVFGPLAGFSAGWMAWLQAVSIAPIE